MVKKMNELKKILLKKSKDKPVLITNTIQSLFELKKTGKIHI